MDDEDPLVMALTSGVGRSPVYRWLRRNQAQVRSAIAQAGTRPNWQGMATLLAGKGVMDGQGKAPSAFTVRTQWRQVLRDLGFDKLRTDLPGPAFDPVPPAFVGVVPVPLTGGRVEPGPPMIVETEDEPFFAGGPKTSKGGK